MATDKILLVTGGGRGIGAAVCLAAGRAGYAVAVNYREKAARAHEIVASIRRGGGRALAVPGDVAVEADVLAMFAINVVGGFLCAREAIRRMSTAHGGTGGCIVNLSSISARLGAAGSGVHYAASKGAIDSMTFGLAQEVAPEGIRVNSVSPGLIDTEIQPEGRIEKMAPNLPMRRAGQADEVAAAVMWLMSDAATYVAGSTFDISGGL